MIITDITRIGDPQVLLYEGKYYSYATSSGEGFLVWESEDLVHWSE
ncbi:MAG: 1,4-beta-xylanase, partial [Ruminococcaceae bacterium]|nr:1,4-beta-xylanase [Oscillospiraceae bacterium]